jgi:hypothetical protein
MIWYAVEVNTVQQIFWKTDCLIDEALDNICFPQETTGIAQVVDGWAIK